MNHLLLIKHSLPEINPAVPAKEWRLSSTGQLRCQPLAESLMSFSPDVIISSTEPKAIETARIVADQLNQTFNTFDDLHEHDRSGAGFLDKAHFERNMKLFFTNSNKLIFGMETADQALERFSHAVSTVEFQHPNKNIAVVTHGTVITLFVGQFNAIDTFSFWQKLDLPSFVVVSLPQHKLLRTVEVVE